jgi:hypothetical protein
MQEQGMTLTEFLLARIANDERDARQRIQMGEGRISAYKVPPPARIHAECEAKRRIVGLHPCDNCGAAFDPCETLRLLALPYADHPDYREEWRP